jgi:hypothetical protein
MNHATNLKYSKTGEWKPIKGKTYIGKNAKTTGKAYKQEAVSETHDI